VAEVDIYAVVPFFFVVVSFVALEWNAFLIDQSLSSPLFCSSIHPQIFTRSASRISCLEERQYAQTQALEHRMLEEPGPAVSYLLQEQDPHFTTQSSFGCGTGRTGTAPPPRMQCIEDTEQLIHKVEHDAW
jgi:hypothetical protein